MASPEEQPLKTKEEIEKTQEAQEFKPKTWKEKLIYLKQNITIEPMLACYVIPGSFSKLATQNLNLDKACRVNKNYGDKICSALIAQEGNIYKTEELAVQELISGMESWKNILLASLPSFLLLFLGAWSDRTGKRKICILLPIIGDMLMILSNILNTYFFYELPVEVAMFFEAFFPAITGAWITNLMGIFSYISDVSNKESRTFRIGIANLCLTGGTPIGYVLSGFLLDKIGYYGVFFVCALMYFVSIVYGFYYIEDPKRPPQQVQNDSSGVCGFLKSFFDINHVKDTFQVSFKKGPNQQRLKFILVLFALISFYGPTCGEYAVKYLFTRYRFNWDASQYSFYSVFYLVTHVFGALITITIFSRRLQWHDSVLGLISISSKICGGLTAAFAKTSTEMYIAVAIETFNATAITALRSISSKLCTSDDLGKMTSIFSLIEVLTSMVFGALYSWIYMLTLKIDASIVYYASAVLNLPALVIFGWFYIHQRKCTNREKKEMESYIHEKSYPRANTPTEDLYRSIDLTVLTEDEIVVSIAK